MTTIDHKLPKLLLVSILMTFLNVIFSRLFIFSLQLQTICKGELLLGNCLTELYFLLLGSLVFVPSVDAVLLLLPFKIRQPYKLGKKIKHMLLVQILTILLTIFLALLLAKIVNVLNIPSDTGTVI